MARQHSHVCPWALDWRRLDDLQSNAESIPDHKYFHNWNHAGSMGRPWPKIQRIYSVGLFWTPRFPSNFVFFDLAMVLP